MRSVIEAERQRRPSPDPRRRLGRHAHARRFLSEDGGQAAAEPGVWDGLLSALRRHSIQDSLAALAVKEREVLHLAFLQGLSNREIAAILSISRSTVRRRIVLGLANLDEQIHRVGNRVAALLFVLLAFAAAGARTVGRSTVALRNSPAASVMLTTAAGAAAGAVVFGAIVTNQGATAGGQSQSRSLPNVIAAAPLHGVLPDVTTPETGTVLPTADLHRNGKSGGPAIAINGSAPTALDPGCDGNPTNAPPVTPVGPRTVRGPGSSPVTHPGKGGCGPHGVEPS